MNRGPRDLTSKFESAAARSSGAVKGSSSQDVEERVRAEVAAWRRELEEQRLVTKELERRNRELMKENEKGRENERERMEKENGKLTAMLETMTKLVEKGSPARSVKEEADEVIEKVKADKGEITQLKEPNANDGALMCGLWLEWLKLDIPVLSDSAGEYWERVMELVDKRYKEWQAADLMTKHSMAIEQEVDDVKWTMLRPRVAKLLLKALPAGIRDELVVQKFMIVEQIMYYVLRRYQPGGMQEKDALLRSIEKVDKQTTARAMCDEIIK